MAGHAAVDDCTRVDRELGVEESVGFFGPSSAPMFGCLHAPLRPPVAAVVVCPSLYADFTLNYRRQVLLCRFLAAHGVLVQRFHYRGTGHSQGDPAAITYDRLVEDVTTAAERTLEVAGSAPFSLVGAGWGGMVAASASRRFPAASLALWEPVTDPARYYKEALRARMIRHVLVPAGRPASSDDLLEELTTSGSLDVLGYLLHRGLYQTSRGRSLTGELSMSGRRLLVVRPKGSDALRTEYGQLVSAWGQAGFAVESATIGKTTPIWFHGPHVRLCEDTAREVASRMHSWLVEGTAA